MDVTLHRIPRRHRRRPTSTPRRRTRPAMNRRTMRRALLKGWGYRVPKNRSQRQHVHNICGDRCFLVPRTLGFPVCSKHQTRRHCRVDPGGLQAAYIRGLSTYQRTKKYKYKKVANQAFHQLHHPTRRTKGAKGFPAKVFRRHTHQQQMNQRSSRHRTRAHTRN